MRTLVLVVAIACAFATNVWAQGDPPTQETSKPISIDQALEIAFQHSPEIKAAVNQLRKSRAAVSETNANFNPKFSAEVVHTRQGPSVSISIPDVGTANIIASQNTAAKGTLYLPLDINRKLGLVGDVARLQFEIDYLSLSRTSQKVIFDVKSACLGLLRANGLEEVAQAAVTAAEARLKDANVSFQAGAKPKFDVTRAEVDVANLNQRLVAARSRTQIARAHLNMVLGIEVSSPTVVADVDASVANESKIDIPESIDKAYNNRPEIKQAEAGIELGKKAVKIERADYLPSMDLAGAYNYQFTASGFSTANESWAALLTLHIPIWNGGVTSARVRQAEAGVAKSGDLLEQARLGVALEVRTAALNLMEAVERVSTAAQVVALAEEALRLASVRYNAGYSPLVEVSDAESALTEARFNYVQAKYDSVIARAELDRATAAQPELSRLQLLEPAEEL